VLRQTRGATQFGDCERWIVIGITKTGVLCEGNDVSCYPLENFSAGWTEEPNIIWDSNPNLGENVPAEIQAGVVPNEQIPALAAKCIIIMGLDANFQVTVKGPDSFKNPEPPFSVSGFMTAVAGGTFPGDEQAPFSNIPTEPVWSQNWRITRNKTDWQTVTVSGTGYVVGGDLLGNRYYLNIFNQPSCGELGTCPSHYAVNFTCSARGDRVETQTKTTILATEYSGND
jgi:hypothetical protein